MAAAARVLFVALEVADPVFSGNGVYARSLLQIILSVHEVLILCGGPVPAQGVGDGLQRLPEDMRNSPNLKGVLQLPLSAWGRLDRASAWQEWATKSRDAAAERVVRAFQAEVVLAVDWTSMPCVAGLFTQSALPPVVWMCFRVFSAPWTPLAAEDRVFYERMEVAALEGSTLAVALSQCDAALLQKLAAKNGLAPPHVHVLNPPLRAEIAQRARARDVSAAPDVGHDVVLCCSRLSPEKNVHVFVAVVEALAPLLAVLGLRPYLCGSAADPDMARDLRARLRVAAPDAAILDFVTPAELAEVMERAVLNFHPAAYEAYGMTIVESAALGTPSILDDRGSVGATDRLPPPTHAFGANMSDPTAVASVLRELLPTLVAERRSGRQHAVAMRAREAALAWGLDEMRAQLLDLVALAAGGGAGQLGGCESDLS